MKDRAVGICIIAVVLLNTSFDFEMVLPMQPASCKINCMIIVVNFNSN